MRIVTFARGLFRPMLLVLAVALFPGLASGQDKTPLDPSVPTSFVSQRYAFGLLDHRSVYGKEFFPEPLMVEEGDVDAELRFDWLHAERRNKQSDTVSAEIEYPIGLLTLEIDGAYEKEVVREFDPATRKFNRGRTSGLGNIEFAARHPIVQYVSADNQFDYTLVGALEVSLPTRSEISKDVEIVPTIRNLLRIGDHVSVQASVGMSYLIGADEGGSQTLEYSAVLGYNIDRRDLSLPGVMRVIPLFELNGTRGMNRGAAGHDELFGSLGLRFNLKPWGRVQPKLGIGYVFPVDKGAKDEFSWGILSSLVFEY